MSDIPATTNPYEYHIQQAQQALNDGDIETANHHGQLAANIQELQNGRPQNRRNRSSRTQLRNQGNVNPRVQRSVTQNGRSRQQLRTNLQNIQNQRSQLTPPATE